MAKNLIVMTMDSSLMQQIGIIMRLQRYKLKNVGKNIFLSSSRFYAALLCAICYLNLVIGSPALAQNQPSPNTPPVTSAPSQVTGGTGTTSPGPEEIPIPAPINPPYELIPSPVAPSEPPTDYIPEVEPPPLLDLGQDGVTVCGSNIRTDFGENDKAVLTAGEFVSVTYRNTITKANTVKIDWPARMAYFTGNVVFRVDDQPIYGDEMELNFKTREWKLKKGNAVLQPDFLQGYVVSPIFSKGESLEGVRDTKFVGRRSHTTTCNYPVPHYEILAKSVTVYPDKWLIIRNATMVVLGHKLITVPLLVYPLRQLPENQQLTPEVGQSQEEGYFLKTTFAYLATAAVAGYINLDLMSKKGIGFGTRRTYSTARNSGDWQVYELKDKVTHQNTFTGQMTHSQLLGDVRTQLSANVRNNSYLYAPQSRSFNSQLSLSRNVRDMQSSLVLSQGLDSVTVQTRRLNGNLTHRQLFRNNMRLDSNFIYNSFGGTNQATTARLTSNAQITRDEGKYDWTISAQKLNDLSHEAFAGQGKFSGIERLPEVSLFSDNTRFPKTPFFRIPLQMKLSYGKYNELPDRTMRNRTYFELNTPVNEHNIAGPWFLDTGAGFRQFVYSDDTAQYSVDANATIKKKLGQVSTLSFAYRYQKPRGFTPFRFDYIARYNNLTANLDVRESDRFKLSLLTGYSIEQKQFPWQDATLRFSIQATDSFLFYTSTAYDLNRSVWRAVINQFRFRPNERFKFDLGTRYDPTIRKWAVIKPVMDTQIGDKTRLEAAASYNGVTKSFEYRSFRLTRDLHCWEASLIYVDQPGFYENQSIMFYLRIKAFPIFEQFGVGSFGQAQDTSVGEIF